MFRRLRPSFLVVMPLLAGLLLAVPARAQAPKGKKVALVVGVRDYHASTLAPLRYTENDAEELAVLLQKQGGFAVRVLTTSRGERRKELAPTAANIRAEIQALLKGRTRHDTALIALAGHGIQGKVRRGGTARDESFFCPADAQLNDNGTLIALGRLFANLGTCGAGVKLLLVDACRNDPTLGRNVELDFLPRAPRGTAALFSCKSGERAFESPELGKGHGVFFHFVLEGLRGNARNEDGEVTWDRLSEYVKRQVSRQVPRLIGGGARQTPQLLANLEGESPVLVVPPRAALVKADSKERPLTLTDARSINETNVNLTGKWSCNFANAVYHIRQVGNEVWWVGESGDGGTSWTNVAHGSIRGNELIMKWADTPKGRNHGVGILTLSLIFKDGKVVTIKKMKMVGSGFGGDTFQRMQ
jgi:hypothetical protein